MSSWNDSVLRVMLDKLSKDEIVDLLISTIKVVCGNDEEHLKNVAHAIVCHAQCKEIIACRSKLNEYEEPHRKELFRLLVTTYRRPFWFSASKLDEEAISIVYEDYKKSKLDYLDWLKSFPNP